MICQRDATPGLLAPAGLPGPPAGVAAAASRLQPDGGGCGSVSARLFSAALHAALRPACAVPSAERRRSLCLPRSAVATSASTSTGDACLQRQARTRSRTPTRRCDIDACFESDIPPGLQWSQSSIAQETLLADLMAAPLDGWSDQSKQKLAKAFGSPESLLCLVLVREDDAKSVKYLARSCSICGMHHVLTPMFGKQLPIGQSLILFQWLKKTYAPLVWGTSYALL